jgi:hypothetical protein
LKATEGYKRLWQFGYTCNKEVYEIVILEKQSRVDSVSSDIVTKADELGVEEELFKICNLY